MNLYIYIYIYKTVMKFHGMYHTNLYIKLLVLLISLDYFNKIDIVKYI
jgi:hypothetical protein